MQFGNNGKMVFSTIEELFSDLFMEIGLAVKNNYVYLQGGDFLKCGDKFIKVSLDGSPVYPGRNDIMFDPANNYALISFLFGFTNFFCNIIATISTITPAIKNLYPAKSTFEA